MRIPFRSKASSRLSPDISRSSRRSFNVFHQPIKFVKKAYAATVKRGNRGNKVVVNQEGSSKLATVDSPTPIESHHHKSYPPDSTSTQQDVTESDTQESTIDAAHLQPVEHAIDNSVTKPESKWSDQHENLSTLQEDRTTVTPTKYQVQESENGTQHELTTFQRRPNTGDTEKGQKQSDDNFEKEKRVMKKELDHTVTELTTAQHLNQELEKRNKHLTNQLTALSIQLQGAENQHKRTLQLLETKTTALKGVQAFLTKEDSLSGADVIAIVDTLNAEILQIAAFMADRLDDTERDLHARSGEAEAARDSAFQSLGGHMVHILRNRRQPDDDSMGLQIALQICLVYSCTRIVESWMPGYWHEGSLLADLHSLIAEKEGQSVSGRWRAITRSHVKQLADFDHLVMTFILAEIGSVLAVAGWSQRFLEEQGFLEILQEKLIIIATLALRLQTAIGESVISGDMQTLLISPNKIFDPDIMEDGFSQDGGAVTEVEECVAGTTDIGLQRSMKGSSIQILRKPKVVLCSALD